MQKQIEADRTSHTLCQQKIDVITCVLRSRLVCFNGSSPRLAFLDMHAISMPLACNILFEFDRKYSLKDPSHLEFPCSAESSIEQSMFIWADFQGLS